jgi:hypothetical protein
MGPMSGDAELDAMGAVKDALTDLDADTQKRVIVWATDRFDITLSNTVKPKTAKVDQDPDANDEDDDEVEQQGNGQDQQFEFFAELYDGAGPSTDKDKVLVACYWQQKILGEATFRALSLNKELKDLGHGVDYISKKMDALIKEKPSLVLQLKKSGSTQQAKKTYKLTAEGIKKVEAMVRSGA